MAESPSINEYCLRTAFQKAWESPSLARSFLESPQSWPALCKGGLENTLRDLLLGPLQSQPELTEFVLTGERNRFDLAVYPPPNTPKPPGGFWHKPKAVLELKFNFSTQSNELNRLNETLDEISKKIDTKILLCGICFVCCVNADKDDFFTRSILHRYGINTHTPSPPIEELLKNIKENSTYETEILGRNTTAAMGTSTIKVYALWAHRKLCRDEIEKAPPSEMYASPPNASDER